MPAVVSKFLSDAVDQYERRGKNVEFISKTILSTAVVAYIVKLSYPHIKRKIKGKKVIANGVNHNNNNINGIDKYSSNNKNDKTSGSAAIEKLKDVKLKIIEKKLQQPGLNIEFLLQLRKLVEIMIPSLVCHETGLLSVHTICLISRTFLSIYVAAMEGAIVKYIVRKDIKNFAWMLMKWFGIAIPATFINSMIRYLENKLALAFR